MGELDLRHTLNEVQAPPGFERMVLARVHEVKEGKRTLARPFLRPRLSWAAGLAGLAVCLVLVNFVFIQRSGRPAISGAGVPEAGQLRGQTVQVMDSVDYGQEVRTVSGDPSTVYILEQVSDSGTSGNIIY